MLELLGQGWGGGERRRPRSGGMGGGGPPRPDSVELIGRPQISRFDVGLVVHQTVIIVIKCKLIAYGPLCRVVKVGQLAVVARAQKQMIYHLRILARVQGMLTVIARVSHRGHHTIRKRDLSIANLEMPKCFER